MRRKDPVFGWAMYGFANHAYVTTVAAAVLPAYFASAVVPAGGFDVLGTRLSATSLWGYAMSLSAVLVFLFAPLLGAIADWGGMKRRFMAALCLAGCVFTSLLAFCGPGDVLPTMLLFVLAQVSYVGSNVFCDAFLPLIARPEDLDRVSGKGFAYGYVGGGLQFALVLGLFLLAGPLGIGEGLAARIGMASAGLWWGAFSLATFRHLDEAPGAPLPAAYRHMPRAAAWLRLGLSQVRATWRAIGRDRRLLVFFLAYVFYNDAIQTVIAMATVYGKEELGLSTVMLMLTLLAIQGVAFLGALAFGALAGRLTTLGALKVSLAVWTGVVVYAYFITTAAEFLVLGLLVGTVMGGSQALSRSLYASMIPVEASAQYFGYFSVVAKFSAIIGPAVFALVKQMTGSARLGVLTLAAFFLVGLAVLRCMRGQSATPGSRDRGAGA